MFSILLFLLYTQHCFGAMLDEYSQVFDHYKCLCMINVAGGMKYFQVVHSSVHPHLVNEIFQEHLDGKCSNLAQIFT